MAPMISQPEWLETISSTPDSYQYRSFVSEGKRLAFYLRNTEHVDMVIALTHMRTNNDMVLSSQVPEIDLILGGWVN